MKHLSLTTLIIIGTVTFATHTAMAISKPPVKPVVPTAVSISAVVAEKQKLVELELKQLKVAIGKILNGLSNAIGSKGRINFGSIDFSKWPGKNIKDYDFNKPQHLRLWASEIVAEIVAPPKQRGSLYFYFSALLSTDELRYFESLSHDKQVELIYEFLSQNPADFFNRQLQTLIIGRIFKLVRSHKEFRKWPKENIAQYNSKNSDHLMIWAKAIVEQDREDLFDAPQTTARKVFKSLPRAEKAELIHKALRARFPED